MALCSTVLYTVLYAVLYTILCTVLYTILYTVLYTVRVARRLGTGATAARDGGHDGSGRVARQLPVSVFGSGLASGFRSSLNELSVFRIGCNSTRDDVP